MVIFSENGVRVSGWMVHGKERFERTVGVWGVIQCRGEVPPTHPDQVRGRLSPAAPERESVALLRKRSAFKRLPSTSPFLTLTCLALMFRCEINLFYEAGCRKRT
jgi:hypothetical protein